MKGIITLTLPKTTPTSEIKRIRKEFNESDDGKLYKLNIFICGNEPYDKTLINFIKARETP